MSHIHTHTTSLQQDALGHGEAALRLRAQQLGAAAELADCAAGDSPKYAICAETNMARWKLFLMVNGYETTMLVAAWPAFSIHSRDARARSTAHRTAHAAQSRCGPERDFHERPSEQVRLNG